MTYDPNRIDPNSPYRDPRVRGPYRYSQYMGPWSWVMAVAIVAVLAALVFWGWSANEDTTTAERSSQPASTPVAPGAPSDRTVGSAPQPSGEAK